jgi:hypothetical protein
MIFQKAISDGILKDMPVEYLSDITTSHIYTTIIYIVRNEIDDEEFIKRSFETGWDMIRRT